MKKQAKFNEAALIGSMSEALAHARGKLTLKTTKVPRRTRSMSPTAIARIRRRLKASTPVFAAYLNVTSDTVRSWEKNRRQPASGGANAGRYWRFDIGDNSWRAKCCHLTVFRGEEPRRRFSLVNFQEDRPEEWPTFKLPVLADFRAAAGSQPSGPALRLLQIAEKRPEILPVSP